MRLGAAGRPVYYQPDAEVVHCEGFFFSSRRRHTMSDRDWSSDVCSSDLLEPIPFTGQNWMPTPTTTPTRIPILSTLIRRGCREAKALAMAPRLSGEPPAVTPG